MENLLGLDVAPILDNILNNLSNLSVVRSLLPERYQGLPLEDLIIGEDPEASAVNLLGAIQRQNIEESTALVREVVNAFKDVTVVTEILSAADRQDAETVGKGLEILVEGKDAEVEPIDLEAEAPEVEAGSRIPPIYEKRRAIQEYANTLPDPGAMEFTFDEYQQAGEVRSVLYRPWERSLPDEEAIAERVAALAAFGIDIAPSFVILAPEIPDDERAWQMALMSLRGESFEAIAPTVEDYQGEKPEEVEEKEAVERPTLEDVVAGLELEIDLSALDRETWLAVDRAAAIANVLWDAGEPTEWEIDRRLSALKGALGEVSEDKVLLPAIAMAAEGNFSFAQLKRLFVRGLREGTVLDLIPPPPELEAEGEEKISKKVENPYKDLGKYIPQKTVPDLAQMDLDRMILDLLLSLVGRLEPLLEPVVESVSHLIDGIPEGLHGALITLGTEVGEMVAAQSGIGGAVRVTQLSGEVLGPGGEARLFAGAASAGLQLGGQLLEFGSGGGSMLATGRVALRVAENLGRSAGLVMDDDGEAMLASYNRTAIGEEASEFDWQQHLIAEIGVKADDIVLRNHRGNTSLIVRPEDVEINGRRILSWLEDLEGRIAALATVPVPEG